MDEGLKINIGADVSDFNRGIAQAQNALSSFGNVAGGVISGIAGFAAAQAVFSGIEGFLKGSIDEALDAEQAFTRLSNTLDNIGRKDVLNGLEASAKRLQQQFKFLDNDDITRVFDRLILYGKLTKDQLEQLTPVIINFASKQGIGIEQASTAIIRALEGNARSLKQYGIELKEAKNSADAFGIVMEQLAPKVDGAADAFGKTTAGQIANTRQAIKDLQEDIGNKLLPAIKSFYSGVAGVVGFLDRLFTTGNLTTELTDLGKTLKSIHDKQLSDFEAADRQSQVRQLKSLKEFIDRQVQIYKERTDSFNSEDRRKFANQIKILTDQYQERANIFLNNSDKSILGSGDPNKLFNPPKIKAPKAVEIPFEFKSKAGITLDATNGDRIINDEFKVQNGLEIPLTIKAPDFKDLKEKSIIQGFINENEALRKSIQSTTEEFDKFFTPVINTAFEALGNGSNVIKALGQSLKALVVQMAATIARAIVLSAILSALPGGSLASGGKGFLGFFKSFLGLGNQAAPNFSGIQGGGLNLAGAVSFNIRGTDLVAVMNRGNAQIGRIG